MTVGPPAGSPAVGIVHVGPGAVHLNRVDQPSHGPIVRRLKQRDKDATANHRHVVGQGGLRRLGLRLPVGQAVPDVFDLMQLFRLFEFWRFIVCGAGFRGVSWGAWSVP